MHLNINSFNAHALHENLYIFNYGCLEKDFITKEECEEQIKEILCVIKDFNKNKDVLYTCMDGEVKSGKPLYLNTIWSFAYKTVEMRNKISKILSEQFNMIDDDCDIYGETQCPFKNDNELV